MIHCFPSRRLAFSQSAYSEVQCSKEHLKAKSHDLNGNIHSFNESPDNNDRNDKDNSLAGSCNTDDTVVLNRKLAGGQM